MAFIALCEGYLGIEPHLEPWRYFFSVSLHKKRERSGDLSMPMGCTGIHLWGHRSSKYMTYPLLRSNKGWHALWFYVKNTATAPLSNFIRRLIEEAPPVWGWGPPPEKEKKRLRDLLDAIVYLKSQGLHGADVIRAYHVRRVVPLMVCALPMYGMMPDAQLDGMVLA